MKGDYAAHQLHSSKSPHAKCGYELKLLERLVMRQENNPLLQPLQLLGLGRVTLR